jgi:inner membrane protein
MWMIFLSSFVSCSGSTGGGIKLIRAQILYVQVYREFIRLLHPNDPWSVALRRDSIYSHRGITHSLLFAAAAALVAMLLVRAPVSRWRVWLVLAAAAASHPLTDMLTNGGSGIALFAPFWNDRFHSPWTPVEVSPLSVSAFISARGVEILLNEAVWVLLPLACVLGVVEVIRQRQRKTL